MAPALIRPYTSADAAAVARVCLLTAEAGTDATGLYSSDELMPDVFARPYLAFDPGLAFVLDAAGVAGYILGVADTRSFVSWYRETWIPHLAGRYEHVVPPVTKDDGIRNLAFSPERMLIPELDEYPAHLHVDILPAAQGSGNGRRLIGALVEALRARGVPGVHLAMDPANTGARAFYDRLGFVELGSSTAEEPVLGLRIGSSS
jgi:ribosomal protein S18 acetylase RimI-like enzyme